MTQQEQQGTLAKFQDMPIDIIAETLQYLGPFDLHNLAMASEEFHEFLTQPRSTFVWKLARKNADIFMDSPPRSLNEIEFAKLLFDEHCHRCKKPGVREVNWDHFTRICEKCSRSLYESRSAGRGTEVSTPLNRVIRQIFPVEDNVERRDPRQGNRRPRQIVHVHPLDVMLLKRAWKNRGNTSTADFVTRYKTVFQERQKDAVACRIMQSKRGELMSKRLWARQDAIIAKLKASGWEEELARNPVKALLCKDPRVDRPILLTEREWKALLPELNHFMAKIRTSELVKQRWNTRGLRPCFEALALVASRWRRQESFELPHPRVRDMASFPEFKKIIESSPDVNVSQESFEKMLPLLPTMFSDWTNQVKRLLQGRVVDTLATHGIPIPTDQLTGGLDPLSLAIAFMFICKDCKTGRQFPEVISHACPLQRLHNCADVILEDDPIAGYEWSASEVLGEGYALQNRVDLAADAAISVIKMYGYNPSEVTAEKMDQSDIRLICRGKCRARVFNVRKAGAMHWRRAMSHAAFEHKGTYSSKENGPPVWEVASEEMAAAAGDLVQAGWQPSASDNVWLCNHCNNPELCTQEELEGHMRIGHSIMKPTDSDIRCDLHCEVIYTNPTKKPSPRSRRS